MYFILVYKLLCFARGKIRLNVFNMLTTNHKQNEYISCMKIAGIPILAPLITEERREELTRYKKQAILVEKRLQERQTVSDNLARKDSGIFTNTSSPKDTIVHSTSNETNFENSQNVSSPANTSKSENDLSKSIDSNLDDSLNEQHNTILESSFVESSETNLVKQFTVNQQFDPPSIGREVIFNSHGINLSPCKDLVLKSALLSPTFKTNDNEDDIKIRKFSDESVNSKNSKVLEIENVVPFSPDNEMFSPPRLVRQNSYTLDTPSPQLIAYMEKQKECENHVPIPLKRMHTWTVPSSEKVVSPNFKPFKSSNSKRTRKNWNLEEAKLKWNNQKKIQIPNRKTPKLKKLESTSLTTSSTTSPVETKVLARSTDCVFSLTKSSDFQTSKNVYSKNSSNKTTGKEKVERISNKQLKSDLQTSPNKKCLTLLCSDKSSDTKAKNRELYCKYTDRHDVATLTPERDTSFNDSCQATESCKAVCAISDHTTSSCDDTMSICSSVSLNRYMTNEAAVGAHALYMDLKLQHQQQFEELLKKHEMEQELFLAKISHMFISSDEPQLQQTRQPLTLSLHPTRLNDTSSELSDKATPCRRQLFSQLKCPLDYTENEKAAAVVITAYVKGYLVRRLFKTDRVKQIISSIRDSISCAFKLHSEKNLTPADIDLHDRLIVQVTAGTFALEEILNMPPAHKMAIIRADREKRPSSRPTSGPVLSSATKRILLRRQQSNSTIKSAENKSIRKTERRKSFSSTTSSGSNHTIVRPVSQLQKSASTGNGNRQPWR